MNNLLDEEYMHIGTNRISRELWKDEQSVLDYNDYAKPIGGLWTSPINSYTICDWMEYETEQDNFPVKYDCTYLNDACIVKVKNNAKLLTIKTKEDFDKLDDMKLLIHLDKPIKFYYYYDYLEFDKMPNYDKIAERYDVIYINPYVDTSLYKHSVITLLILNPDVIEYYKPVVLNLEKMEIHNAGEKSYLEEVSADYKELVKKIEGLFTDINTNDYKIYIEKLYEMKRQVEMLAFKKHYKNMDNNVIHTIIENEVAKRYKAKRKELLLK